MVEPTLAPHNQDFASNIELLRKSKEDCTADVKLRESANRAAHDSFDRDVDELEPVDFYFDAAEDTESFRLQDESFNAETLIAAYHSISKAWQRETLVTGRRIPPLVRGTIRTQSLLI